MSWQGQDWQGTIETSLRGLGYELVDAERSAGGLLRVTIDHLPSDGHAAAQATDAVQVEAPAITVDDCERATRQLQRVLEVEGVDYQRLEVSSPGLDRPLKRASDYARFVGQAIELTLKVPFQGRKRWQGELQANGDGWQLVLAERAAPAPKAAAKATPKGRADAAPKAHADAAPKALAFTLDEVREAHLVPVIDFKGRGRGTAEPAPKPQRPARGRAARADAPAELPDAAARPAPAAQVDGGRIR